MEDAAAPLFKRSLKSKPAQRSRQASPDAADDAGGSESPTTLAAKLKTKVKRAKPKSKLSFGGDEQEGDGEVFQVKKSNLSKSIAHGRHPATVLSASMDQASISPKPSGQPTYDKAYLSELKASNPTSRPRVTEDVEMSMDPLENEGFEIMDTTPDISILSESQIQAAKRKRDQLRKNANARDDDFISLTVARAEIPRGPHPDSRLVREEDEVGEAEEEYADFTSAQERIALGKKSKKAEAAKRLENMKDLINDAEEYDEEGAEWEQAQIRRAGHTASDFANKSRKEVYKAASIPPVSAIPTLGPAIARLTQSLTTLTTSHTTNTAAMTGLAEERIQIDAREVELRQMVVEAEGKRSWFAAFRDWVESVATFLDEKFPMVEKLEEVHLSLLKERYQMIVQRRVRDDEDDLATFLGDLPTPPSPDYPLADRRERTTARSTRRFRRRATLRGSTEEDGFSTDGSLAPSEATDYDDAISKLEKDAKAILADVLAEEFRNPTKGIEKWFGQWRSKYADSYTGAWGGLGLVGSWEFWVRLEIIGWNPLEDSRSMDTFAWYTSLYEYSRPRTGDDGDAELGPDGDLVSAMISTAVLPRLCTAIESGAFDPYSAKSLKKMMDLAEEVEASVEPDSLKFKTLIQAVYTVFRGAVVETENLVAPYLSLNDPRLNPETIPARRRFLMRRTKMLQNILRWRKYTSERYGVGELCTRIVSRCMMPVATTGWDVGGEECIRKLGDDTGWKDVKVFQPILQSSSS